MPSSWPPKDPADKLPEGLGLPEKLFARHKDQIERMPFVINDEVDCAAAYATLKQKAINPDTDVFFGISGLRSLDILSNIGRDGAGGRYNKAVLFDSNYTQTKAMNAVMVLIKDSNSPQEFVDKFVPEYLKWVSKLPRQDFAMKDDTHANQRAKTKQKKKGFTPKPSGPHELKRRSLEDVSYFAVAGANYPPRIEEKAREYFAEQMQNPDSWLQEDNFKHIKSLAEQGRIETINLNLDDRNRFDALTGWLLSHKYRAGDIYLSSILALTSPEYHFDYWGRQNTKAVRDNININLRNISDEKTNFLNSHPEGIKEDKAAFTLRVENKECNVLKAFTGPVPDIRKKQFNYVFNLGHATCTIKNPSKENLRKAFRNPVIQVYDAQIPNWTEKMLPLELLVTCPDYTSIEQNTAFIDRCRPTIAHVMRKDFEMQDLERGWGDRSCHIVFLAPVTYLQNKDFFRDLSKEIRKALTTGKQEGLMP